jgi:hypothetical protein
MTDAARPDPRCSFCAASNVPLAAGPRVYICERCARLACVGFGVPIADEPTDDDDDGPPPAGSKPAGPA